MADEVFEVSMADMMSDDDSIDEEAEARQRVKTGAVSAGGGDAVAVAASRIDIAADTFMGIDNEEYSPLASPKPEVFEAKFPEDNSDEEAVERVPIGRGAIGGVMIDKADLMEHDDVISARGGAQHSESEALARQLGLDAVKLHAMHQAWREMEEEAVSGQRNRPSFLHKLVHKPHTTEDPRISSKVALVEQPDTNDDASVGVAEVPALFHPATSHRIPPPRSGSVVLHSSCSKTSLFIDIHPPKGSLEHSLRVGWGPGFKYICRRGSSITIRRVQVFGSGDGVERTAEIERLLMIHSSRVLSTDDRASACKAYVEDNSARSEDAVPLAINQARIVWKLINALWIDGPTAAATAYGGDRMLAIRDFLSAWLAETVAGELDLSKCSTDSDAIYTLLSGHRIREAFDRAISSKYYRVATIIAQEGRPGSTMHHLQDQIRFWKRHGTWEQFDRGIRQVFALLAGVALPELFREYSWKRCLGIELWYRLPWDRPTNEHSPRCDMRTLISSFECRVASSEATAPFPYYGKAANRKDASFSLLQLYADSRFAPWIALDPLGFSPDALDVSSSWLLNDFLQCKGHRLGHVHVLYVAFAAQLEAIGLWKWAVYVIISSRVPHPSIAHDQIFTEDQCRSIVRDILLRNWPSQKFDAELCSVDEDAARSVITAGPPKVHLGFRYDEPADTSPRAWTSSSEREVSQQLQEWSLAFGFADVGTLIWEAKAQRARYDGLAHVELDAWLKANRWNRAYECFMSSRAADLFIYNDRNELLRFLALFREHQHEFPQAWKRGGDVLLLHYSLLDNIAHGDASEALSIATRILELLNQHGAADLAMPRPPCSSEEWSARSLVQRVCKAEMASRSLTILPAGSPLLLEILRSSSYVPENVRLEQLYRATQASLDEQQELHQQLLQSD